MLRRRVFGQPAIDVEEFEDHLGAGWRPRCHFGHGLKGAKSAKGAEGFLRRRASSVSRRVVGESQAMESVPMHFEQKDTKGTKSSKGTG